MHIQQILGANVKRLRTSKGWSQEEFAFEAGIHRTYVSDIERGARNPTIDVLERLARPLGVAAADLIRQSDPA
ncbi:MAG: helix-turn-helix domain-containing protein [Alphaproteobacteria bacterium]|jgi:transcriptional regulator with XRE-family HTH domain|nr:helix-turn-helix domain-containing protein [Alphaproteobacteria bacterium]